MRPYYPILRQIHRLLEPRNYLEIGVQSGGSLVLARPETDVIGVDPSPEIREPLTDATRICRMESDFFFSLYEVDRLFQTSIYLAFIDGLHEFRQVVRDFRNIERFSAPETVVLIHDCIPITEATSTKTQQTPVWTGDVWKIVPFLAEVRKDLSVSVLDVPPSGLGIITGLNPADRTLWRCENRIEEYDGLHYGYVEGRKREVLNVIDSTSENIQEVLDA